MSFLQLILKNLLRRRSRSLLTLAGIAIGIGAVVSLSGIASGFERSWANVYKARGTDLVITKTIARSTMPGPFPATLKSEIQKLPHVREVGGLLSDVFSVEDSPTVLVIGWEPKTSLWKHVTLGSGRWPDDSSTDTVAIGSLSAEMLNKKLGDKIQIETREFTVCGIFRSAALAESGAIVMPLPAMQSLTEKDGMVNFFDVWLEPRTTPAQTDELRALIKTKFSGLTAFDPGAVSESNLAMQIAKAMTWAVSSIALVVGAIGVMNTILMSVFERLHEIGILLAIGWRRARIMQMILAESLLLGLIGGILGCGLGVAAARLLERSPWVAGKLEASVDPALFGIALLIAIALGGLGGLYPAWIGSRMSPARALRQ
ncbi:MAG TPA: FtsX-like permease family protein [Chthoniobacterales bacterium]|jgi:putative ABC transport system permease protein|nr:FtsX-like permease family protein [Chthoniobacterales bacterium]